jgi:hypothetical protein
MFLDKDRKMDNVQKHNICTIEVRIDDNHHSHRRENLKSYEVRIKRNI